LKDLRAVKEACRELGLTFVEGRKTYAWYGASVGDTALPEGITREQLGHCEHVIQVPGAGYEIGLVKNPKTGGFRLLFDYWGPGKKIVDTLGGQGVPKLIQAYGICKATIEAKARGYLVTRQPGKNGSVNLILTQV